jgi:hypothetical protein
MVEEILGIVRTLAKQGAEKKIDPALLRRYILTDGITPDFSDENFLKQMLDLGTAPLDREYRTRLRKRGSLPANIREDGAKENADKKIEGHEEIVSRRRE